MKSSPTTAAIFTALAKAQAELKNAKFDSQNPHFRNNYASLESVLETIKPVFAKHGLALFQCPDRTEDGGFVLSNILTHESGEFIQTEAPIILTKNDMQGLGSAITYQRRYSAQGIAGIGSDDDDGNEASKPGNKAGVYTIPFGKHKGKTIPELGKEEARSYGSWLTSQEKSKQGDELLEKLREYLAEKKA